MSVNDDIVAVLSKERDLTTLRQAAKQFAQACAGNVGPLLSAGEGRVRRGDYDGAAACFDAALAGTDHHGLRACTYLLRGNLELFRRRADAAFAALDAGLKAAHEFGNASIISDLLWSLGNASDRFCDSSEAIATWQRGIVFDEARGLADAALLKRGALDQALLLAAIRAGQPLLIDAEVGSGSVAQSPIGSQPTKQLQIEALQTTALRLVSVGRVSEGVATLDAAIVIGDTLRDPSTSALTRLMAASALLESEVGVPQNAAALAKLYLDAAEPALIADKITDQLFRLYRLRAVALRRTSGPSSVDTAALRTACGAAYHTMSALHDFALDPAAATEAWPAFESESGAERSAAFFVDTLLWLGDLTEALLWVEAVKTRALSKLMVDANAQRGSGPQTQWDELLSLVGSPEGARRTDLKAGSLVVLQQSRKKLGNFFGDDRAIDSITAADATDFKNHGLQGLSRATTSKVIQHARQYFRDAVRRRLISESPFADLKAGPQKNKSRQVFVDRASIDAAIAACKHFEWKLIIGLARYGGLRIPSEILPLTVADIHWDEGYLFVRSPKTERHEGGESRNVPIYPELRPLLEEAVKNAGSAGGPLIRRHRGSNMNLRTQFQRILKHAGVKPWPRLFQNLRSSRQTELAEQFPAHVVCQWMGNSEDVAKDHYLQVLDEHVRRASSVNVVTPQIGTASRSGQSSAATTVALRDTSAAKSAAALARTESREVANWFAAGSLSDVVAAVSSDMPLDAIPCDLNLLGEEGFEPSKA